jgi:hypothetical protein
MAEQEKKAASYTNCDAECPKLISAPPPVYCHRQCTEHPQGHMGPHNCPTHSFWD